MYSTRLYRSQRRPPADQRASSSKSAASKLSAEERERRLKAMQANAQMNADDRVARLDERRKESAREAAVLIEKAKAAKASCGASASPPQLFVIEIWTLCLNLNKFSSM